MKEQLRRECSLPCTLVDLPAATPSAEIRYLTQCELLAVLERGVPDGPLQVLERARYVMAAMTGLRQGELLGLRWMDVDGGARTGGCGLQP